MNKWYNFDEDSIDRILESLQVALEHIKNNAVAVSDKQSLEAERQMGSDVANAQQIVHLSKLSSTESAHVKIIFDSYETC